VQINFNLTAIFFLLQMSTWRVSWKKKNCDAVVVAMSESRCYTDSPVLAEHQPFNRNGKALRYDYDKCSLYRCSARSITNQRSLICLRQRRASIVHWFITHNWSIIWKRSLMAQFLLYFDAMRQFCLKVAKSCLKNQEVLVSQKISIIL